jgi:type I restriction enzyme M protein
MDQGGWVIYRYTSDLVDVHRLQAFSAPVRDIFESFDFHTQIDRLARSELLYLVTEKFANIDLDPEIVSNAQMGAVFEELIRKFAELSNETTDF